MVFEVNKIALFFGFTEGSSIAHNMPHSTLWLASWCRTTFSRPLFRCSYSFLWKAALSLGQGRENTAPSAKSITFLQTETASVGAAHIRTWEKESFRENLQPILVPRLTFSHVRKQQPQPPVQWNIGRFTPRGCCGRHGGVRSGWAHASATGKPRKCRTGHVALGPRRFARPSIWAATRDSH